MCPNDNMYLLKVSNMGTAVQVNNTATSWRVPLPPMLANKGPCSITILQGRITMNDAAADFNDVAKVWCETSIPIQGASTQVNVGQSAAGYHELFDVELTRTHLAADTVRSCYMRDQKTFRCAGGLPPSIDMTALYMLTTDPPATNYTAAALYGIAATQPQIEFHLAVVFDEQ
jgi:hypothetical protein